MKPFVTFVLALALSVVSLCAQAPAEKPTPAAQSAPAASTAGSPNKPASAYIAPTQDSNQSPVMTVWQLIQTGGWAMIPLGVLSFLTVMLVLNYWVTLRRSAVRTTHYMNTADVLLKKRDYLGLLAISSRHSEAVARVVQRALDFATKNPGAPMEVVRNVAQSEGSAQAASLQHRVTYLADIGTLSPMVGLLGTVVGIIRSFGSLGSGMVGQNRDWAMASGVSEALIATGGGLIVGLVAFTFYAFFRNKVQSLISDLEVASEHIMGLIAINYNKKREPSRATADEELF